MKKYTIDRIEGDIVVAEGENGTENFKLSELPEGVKPGDCIELENGKFSINRDETNTLREKNVSLLNKLKNKKK